MYFTKEYITGVPLDLKKYTLGIIKQPIVDYFMYDYDFIDFIKPYYMGLSLSYDEVCEESKLFFTIFLEMMNKSKKILNDFYRGLTLLYDTSLEDMGFFQDEEKRYILRIDEKGSRKENKDGIGNPIAFITDENFVILCKIILEMSHFEEPQKPTELKGDPELVKRFKQKQREYYQKRKVDNSILFENVVREVMYFRNINSYEEIRNKTIWWLRDCYSVEALRSSEQKQWQMASGGKYSPKKIKSWQKITKLKK
jgi:hypothetical protein